MDPLAGFDLSFQLSEDAVLAMLRPTLAALNLAPPAEQVTAIAITDGGGNAHFVLLDASVAIGPSNTLKLTITFGHSSIIGNSLVQAIWGGSDAVALSGTIALDFTLALTTPITDATARQISATLGPVRATVNPQAAAPAATHNYSVLQAAIEAAVSSNVSAMGGVTPIPLPVRVDHTATASISPLVCKNLVMTTAAPSSAAGAALSGASNALGLFADLRAATGGDVTQFIASSVPTGQDALMTISAETFHTLVFTPAMMADLQVSSATLLPATCGGSQSVPYPSLPQWSVDYAADTLQSGGIEVEIKASSIGSSGSTTWVDFTGLITLAVDAGTIAPTWTTTSSSGGMDFDAEWWLGGLLSVGIYTLMGVAWGLADAGAGQAGSQLVPSLGALTLSLPIHELTIASVLVEPTDLSVGAVATPSAPIFDFPQLGDFTITTSIEAVVENAPGTYVSQGCPLGSFPYQRTLQVQQFTFVAHPQLMSYPVTYTWTLGGDPPITLTGSGGTATLRSMSSTSGPPPQATRVGPVTLSYQIVTDNSTGASTLTVSNVPQDGNYYLDVSCHATDIEGRTGVALGHVNVQGDLVTMGGGWDVAVAGCVHQLAKRLRQGLGGVLVNRVPVAPGDNFINGVDVRSIMAAAIVASASTKDAATARNLAFTYRAAMTARQPSLALKIATTPSTAKSE